MRGEAPPLLAKYGRDISKDYADRRQRDPGYGFQWPQRDGARLYDQARAAAGQMTGEHCAYCDGFWLGATGESALDHFRPKSRPEFYDLVCEWTNLFLCCSACNRAKREQWYDELLRPDDPEFEFERFFEFKFDTGAILPNPLAKPDDQGRARQTIAVLDLNRIDACSLRKRAVRSLAVCAVSGLEDEAYRFLWPVCGGAGA